jgi:hypothetical protein
VPFETDQRQLAELVSCGKDGNRNLFWKAHCPMASRNLHVRSCLRYPESVSSQVGECYPNPMTMVVAKNRCGEQMIHLTLSVH